MIRNKMLMTLTFVGLGGALGLVACSSDETTDKYPSSDSFCAAKVEEECKAGAPVCGTTVESCKTMRLAACKEGASAATGQNRTYRAQQADRCITDTKTLYETKVVDLEKEKTVNETCERVFTGAKKKGDPCAPDGGYECEGTLVCSRGSCSEKVEKKLDEPCNNPGDTCAKGTYCGPRGANDFCNALNKLGDLCDPKKPCEETLRCQTSCVERLESGQSCDVGTDCKTSFCDPQKKCAAKLVPGEKGCPAFGG